MTILILNWRDIKNPSGGGAEILTHEMAKRWVIAGNKVIHISSAFKNARRREKIDGVTYIRSGTWWNVQFFAFLHYIFFLRKQIDVIVDEVHWFPFFSIIYAPRKTVALVCEVADKLFFTIFPYPFALVWRTIEKIYLFFYKKVPTMVISQSTYNDLIKEGHIASNIVILPMGLTLPSPMKQYPKEKNSTLIYVARLNQQKGIFDVLKAFALLHKKLPSSVLWIVGSGTQKIMQQVKNLMIKENITHSVVLFGYVDGQKKFELLSKSHVLISASVQEGWGLTIPEAGITKTPSVVYNTNGFCDIIENNKNGLLVEHKPEALSDGVLSILCDKRKYQRFQYAIYKTANKYSWENTASISLNFLHQQKKIAA